MAPGVGGLEPAVTLDQVPRWSNPDQRLPSSPTAAGSEAPASSFLSFADPLDAAAGAGGRGPSRFPVDDEVTSKIYLWRGQPWNLEAASSNSCDAAKMSGDNMNNKLQLVMKSGKYTLGYKTVLRTLRSSKCKNPTCLA